MSTIIVKKGDTMKSLQKKLERLAGTRRGIDTEKYCGMITLAIDPKDYQKESRDEWSHFRVDRK